MALKNIDSSPLAIAQFQAKAATNIEAAITWARDAGYKIPAALVPTPLSDARANIVARAGGHDAAASVFDSIHGMALAAERRALQMAVELAGDAGDGPLVGLTKTEKISLIMARKAELGALASYRALQAMDEAIWAEQFKRQNLAEFMREANDEGRLAHANEAQQAVKMDREAALQGVRVRHSTSQGLVDSPAYRAEVDAVNQQYADKLKQLLGDIRGEADRANARVRFVW